MDTLPSDLRTIFDPSTLVRKGLCPVSDIRNPGDPTESHSLYFEQHGTGPEKIIFVMGLNSTSFAWLPQVSHFGRSQDYSILVYDNRGVGNSSSPKGPYTTSGMAEDAITLLSYVGWTEKRDLHVVGLSLGGMIAQELAYRIPERLTSLALCVTTPGGGPWYNMPPRGGMLMIGRTMTIKDPHQKVPIVVNTLFPQWWLETKTEEGRTNREIQEERYRHRIDFTRPQPFIGGVSQMSAGLTHNVQPARLRHIDDSVPKVLILTGTDDHLVHPSNSQRLKDSMPQAELQVWDQFGHGINAQDPVRFNALLERVWKEGREKVNEA